MWSSSSSPKRNPGQPHEEDTGARGNAAQERRCPGTGATVGVVVAGTWVLDGTPVQVDVPGGTLMISIDNLTGCTEWTARDRR